MTPTEEMEAQAKVNMAALLDTTCLRAWKPSLVPQRGIARVLGNIAAKGFLTTVAAAGGTSKSTLVAHMALGLATGRKLVGPDIPAPAKCVVLGLEDDQDFIERSYTGAAQRHGIVDADMQRDLMLVGKETYRQMMKLADGEGAELVVLDPTTRGPVLRMEAMKRLEALLAHTAADMLVVDPLAVIYGGVQMTNETMNLLFRSLSDLAQKTSTSIMLVSHTRKQATPSRAQGADDVKHGGELVDTSRCVVVVRKLTKEERESLQAMAPGDYRDVRVAVVEKTNIGRSGERFYYRIETEKVLCQDGTTETVPVLVEFALPKPVSAATPQIFNSIEDDLRDKFVARAPNAAGARIKDILEATGPCDWKAVLDDMVAKGWVKVVQEVNPDSKSKHPVNRVVVDQPPVF
jgi:RecA-family ATPase